MHRRRLLFATVAALLCGVGLASLQLLLWPQIVPSMEAVCLASLAWGTWSALWLGLGAFALWEVAAFGGRLLGWRPRRDGLWLAMVAAGLLVAGVAFLNQQATRELIPAAHRQAMGVVGSVGILWAGVWLAVRRLRSPWLTGLLVAAWVVGVWWPWWGVRQAANGVEMTRGVQERTWESGEKHRKALVVVWEGADIPWLLPHMDGGRMPFLQSLWPQGSWGQLRTIKPFSRAATLATLATGCSPVHHRVVARRAYRLVFLGGEPVSLLLRGPWPSPHQLPWRLWERASPPRPQEPTLWEALEGLGIRASVVQWPFPWQEGDGEVTWEGSANLEPSWQAAVDEAIGRDSKKAGPTRRAFALAAEAGVRAALRVLEGHHQVLVVHVDLPARLRPIWPEEDPGGVLSLAAQFLDNQLAELWALFGDENSCLLLVSPYGMAPPSPGDRLLASVGLGRRWPVSPKDSPDGFFFLLGRGVKRGGRVRGARVADTVPTLMYLLELPVARKLSGRVMLEAVDEAWAASVPLRLVTAYPWPRRS